MLLGRLVKGEFTFAKKGGMTDCVSVGLFRCRQRSS